MGPEDADLESSNLEHDPPGLPHTDVVQAAAMTPHHRAVLVELVVANWSRRHKCEDRLADFWSRAANASAAVLCGTGPGPPQVVRVNACWAVPAELAAVMVITYASLFSKRGWTTSTLTMQLT
jgi:hypothetical protein